MTFQRFRGYLGDSSGRGRGRGAGKARLFDGSAGSALVAGWLFQKTYANGLNEIQGDGWSGFYTGVPSEFDPVGAPVTFVDTRKGFDAGCNPTTVDDIITIMKRLRKPHPYQASKTAYEVVLSDPINYGDIIAGVPNTSGQVAPPPICMWLDHDRQRAVGQSYTAKLAVAHMFARNGTPVAAVKFIATDGTTTVEQVVSAMSKADYTASGLSVPHFAATLNLATLTANVLVTIDAIIYPWVGAAYRASINGSTYPSINFTTMRVLNDNGSYGTAYAYVSPTGNNGTGVTSATPATAQASPYLTVAAAAAAIKVFNNANYSRDSTSGGIVRLEAGTYTHASFSASTSGDIPLVIEAANPANKATTIYQDAGAHVFTGLPQAAKFKDLTIKRNSASNFVFLDSGGTQSRLILENCTNNDGGFGPGTYGAYIDEVSFVWVINCDGAELGFGLQFGVDRKQLNVIGSTHSLGAVSYNLAGCKVLNASVGDASSQGNRDAIAGRFIGFNFLGATGNVIFTHDDTIGAAGLGFVGNIIEARAGVQPALQISGGNNRAENVVMQVNTVVGQRTIHAYNDAGGAVKRGAPRLCVFDQYNAKGDVFATNGAWTGNWPVIFKVGARASALLYGDNNADVFGTGEWAGELAAFGDVIGTDATPIVANWTLDASLRGTGLGNGNYTPGVSTALPFIPSGLAPYAWDLYGTPVANDGSARIGARQAAAAAGATGSLAATETGKDTAVGAGSAALTGVAAATEIGTDTAVATGTVGITGFGSAIEQGNDTATAAGAVAVTGVLAATEIGSDTCVASGTAAQTSTGVLAAVEAGSDTAVGLGTVAASGVVAAVETGSDTGAGIGSVGVSGAAVVTEVGADTCVATGFVAATATGVVAASETGSDSAAGTGTARVSGLAAISETGTDTVTGAGFAIISGILAAVESGADTCVATGFVTPTATGVLAATETGSDSAAGTGTARVSGLAAISETGTDTVTGAGFAIISGILAAVENGADTCVATGFVTPTATGVLAATETGSDSLSSTGTARVSGLAAISETGADTVTGAGFVIVSGILAAMEAGADICVAFGSVTDAAIYSTGRLAFATKNGRRGTILNGGVRKGRILNPVRRGTIMEITQ